MTTAEPKLRPIGPEDLPFLRRLYAAGRAAEMARSGWPDDAIAGFLAQQFELQHRYYQTHYADGEFLLVELDGRPVGRLYLYWGRSALQLIDIALLPEQRGHGLGATLLTALLARADAQGLAVGLYVEGDNPARHWYLRQGFAVSGENGVYLQMQRLARPLLAASQPPIAQRST